MLSYPIPAHAQTVVEETIKKSRFITYLVHTVGTDEAKRIIQDIRQQHPAARHHCWAYVAGAPNDSQQLGFSDDGEPSGTAGKPMLAQLMGSGLGEVTAIVVRYYGGVMLGTGGLVKAYGGGVQLALKHLERQLKIPKQTYRLDCQYAQLAEVERIIQRFQGDIIDTQFTEQVRVLIALPESFLAECHDALTHFSRGELLLQQQ
ncbi:IMPACT family protein [Rosenbergiella australiborealis]|uniref:IMPACT family protein n=1 Tax=Rosenbergiella australiborealis TaxID=1544696 RepID=A0ABS5T5H8_9GAMM|nr:IMPACT family protein [Rosenbergiella australiborealis]MBT0727601.1 IMPACT family protein [Rosenbergiella australiborealis]